MQYLCARRKSTDERVRVLFARGQALREKVRQLIKLAQLPERKRRPLPRSKVAFLFVKLLRVLQEKEDNGKDENEWHQDEVGDRHVAKAATETGSVLREMTWGAV